ncbi:MAG TPA: hypothetical protein VFQ80_11630 [Thermomicrobiales bacterium]|nr:hypothetical protein [Thermomicrobiales bacterium]
MLVSIQTQFRRRIILTPAHIDSTEAVNALTIGPQLDKVLEPDHFDNAQGFGTLQIASLPPDQLSPANVPSGTAVHPLTIQAVVVPAFSTWNDADRSANLVLSNGNKTVTQTGGGDGAVRAFGAKTAGQWYCELALTALIGGDSGAGLANAAAVLNQIGNVAADALIQFRSGVVYYNGAAIGNNGPLSGGGTLRMAYNADIKRLWLALDAAGWNGGLGGGDPATNTAGVDVSTIAASGGLMPCFSGGAVNDGCTGNWGATAFAYAKPAGYNAWTP